MLRLTLRSVLAGLLWTLAIPGLARPLRETMVVDRDGVQFDFSGGCVDRDASTLWLFVHVRHSEEPSDTLELWFADLSGDGHSNRVRVVGEIGMSPFRSVGCVVGRGTKLVWHLVDRGRLRLHRLSHHGLEPIRGELAGHWDYPVKAVRLARGILTFVANDAVGIFDLEAGTLLARHERWTVAAWIQPGTGELYSVRSLERIDDDADGFPPVALTREAVLPGGGLRLLARTDPWPAMQPVEDGADEEIGYVNYNLAAARDKVVLIREHFFGTGRLQVTMRDMATLRNPRTLVVDRRTGGDVMDAVSFAGQAAVAVLRSGSESVRLLHIDPAGRVRESAAPPVHDGPLAILDFQLFDAGQSVYAVATQSFTKPNGKQARPLTIDVFGVQADYDADAGG